MKGIKPSALLVVLIENLHTRSTHEKSLHPQEHEGPGRMSLNTVTGLACKAEDPGHTRSGTAGGVGYKDRLVGWWMW